MPSVVEVNEEASRKNSLEAAEPWQKHNGRLSATDRPIQFDSEPPESETKFEDVVDQVTITPLHWRHSTFQRHVSNCRRSFMTVRQLPRVCNKRNHSLELT